MQIRGFSPRITLLLMAGGARGAHRAVFKLGSPPAAALTHTLQRSWSKKHWEAAGGGRSCIYKADLCSGAPLRAPPAQSHCCSHKVLLRQRGGWHNASITPGIHPTWASQRHVGSGAFNQATLKIREIHFSIGISKKGRRRRCQLSPRG